MCGEWFAPSPAVAAEVRRRLAKDLAAWGFGAEESEAAVLVANELVANAVEHARTEFRLIVGYDERVVHIRVRDRSVQAPRLQPHDPSARRGRGLQVVAAVAECWGWTPEPGGKTVWADVAPRITSS